jgi:hypothetical protein
MMNVSTKIRDVRTVLADRRTERVARRRLSEELAAYQTPAERTELDQMIGRYSAEETREIREILNRQDYERQRTTTGIGGHRAA